MKKFVSMVMIIVMFICMMTSCYAKNFPDVEYKYVDSSRNHWAERYIYYLSENGMIDGYPDGTYKPDKQVTRGEFIKMLACVWNWKPWLEQVPENNDHWARIYVGGITFDKDEVDYNTANLDEIISRGEMCQLLYRNFFIRNAGIIEKSDIKADSILEQLTYLSKMIDSENIPETQKYAVNVCIRFGLINGFEDSSFRASEGLTRAQAAKIIYMDYYYKIDYAYMADM